MSTRHDIRDQADRFLHHYTTELALLALIVVSVVLTVVEVAMRPGLVHSVVEGANDGITALFVVELALRYWVARKKRRFFQRYWIDILAVLPPVRPLRVFRVLRIFRLYRAGVLMTRRFSVFNSSFRGTSGDLFAVVLGSLVLLLSTAMMLFIAEGRGAVFGTFEDALWFASFSLVAGEPVGPTPVTELGRWTTLLLMVGGAGLFGVFVGTVSAGVAQRLSANLEQHELDLDELSEHVVICGWNKSGPTVLTEVFAPGTPPDRAVVLITESPAPPADLPMAEVRREHLYHHHGDYTQVDVLEAVSIKRASIVILLTDEIVPRSPQDRDARTVLAALTIERMAPHIYTVAEQYSRQNEELLRMAGVEEIVIGDWYAGIIIGSVAANRGLVSVLDEILTAAHGNTFHTMELTPRWVGRTVAELHNELFVRHRAVLISVENPPRNVVVNPEPTRELMAGDRLVVLCGDDFVAL
ncbi:MAG: voltage-gated potassium channel [Myxococcota bacterium]|jgi:voltage-gated potassium channel